MQCVHMMSMSLSNASAVEMAAVRPGPLMSQVPAVILVCRNSTDTAYFQRLRPYPRIMLLRYNTRFKDYVSLILSSESPHMCEIPLIKSLP